MCVAAGLGSCWCWGVFLAACPLPPPSQPACRTRAPSPRPPPRTAGRQWRPPERPWLRKVGGRADSAWGARASYAHACHAHKPVQDTMLDRAHCRHWLSSCSVLVVSTCCKARQLRAECALCTNQCVLSLVAAGTGNIASGQQSDHLLLVAAFNSWHHALTGGVVGGRVTAPPAARQGACSVVLRLCSSSGGGPCVDEMTVCGGKMRPAGSAGKGPAEVKVGSSKDGPSKDVASVSGARAAAKVVQKLQLNEKVLWELQVCGEVTGGVCGWN